MTTNKVKKEVNKGLSEIIERLAHEQLGIVEEFRPDFPYTKQRMKKFKKHLKALIKPKYYSIEEMEELLELLSQYFNVETPNIRFNNELKSIRGRYIVKTKTIETPRPCRLGVLLHEYAHHLDRENDPLALANLMRLALYGLMKRPNSDILYPFTDHMQYQLKRLRAHARRKLEKMKSTLKQH